MLAVSLAFVAVGVLLLLQGDAGLVPWTTIIFFGGCSLVFGWQLIDDRPRITITHDGIEDRSLKVGRIEWRDIAGVYLWRQQGHPFLGL